MYSSVTKTHTLRLLLTKHTYPVQPKKLPSPLLENRQRRKRRDLNPNPVPSIARIYTDMQNRRYDFLYASADKKNYGRG